MNLSLEQRVVRLEGRAERARAMVTKLYQTFYAAQIRRGNTYGQMLKKTKDRLAVMSKQLPTFFRLSRLAREMDKGKTVMTLTMQEHQLLHAMLKRQKPYARRDK